MNFNHEVSVMQNANGKFLILKTRSIYKENIRQI